MSQIPVGALIDRLAAQAPPQQQAATPQPTPSIASALNPGSIAYMLFFGGVAWGGAQLAEHLWTAYGKPKKKRASRRPPDEENDEDEEVEEEEEDEEPEEE